MEVEGVHGVDADVDGVEGGSGYMARVATAGLPVVEVFVVVVVVAADAAACLCMTKLENGEIVEEGLERGLVVEAGKAAVKIVERMLAAVVVSVLSAVDSPDVAQTNDALRQASYFQRPWASMIAAVQVSAQIAGADDAAAATGDQHQQSDPASVIDVTAG